MVYITKDPFNATHLTSLVFNPEVYHQESLNKGEQNTELHIGFRNIKIDGLPLNYILKENFDAPVEFKQYKDDFHKCCLEIIEEQEACEIGKELILKSLIMKFWTVKNYLSLRNL